MRQTMLNLVKGLLSQIFQTKEVNGQKATCSHSERVPISSSINKNINYIKSVLGKSDDIVYRNINVLTIPSRGATIIFIGSLVDNNTLESSVIMPLTQAIAQRQEQERISLCSDLELLVTSTITSVSFSVHKDMGILIDEVLSGKGMLLMEGWTQGIALNIAKETGKKSAEPKTEKVVKGPQQGFVEDISENASMIRKRIQSCHLVMKEHRIGRQTKTKIMVAYMDNIADKEIVKKLFNRINKIDVDGIVGSSNIGEYIRDSPGGLFPTTFYSERPDRIQAMILEGRIAILCEGTPFVIMVPAIVSDFFISSGDYYMVPFFSSFNRLLSYAGALVTMFLPATYIAITTFHQEMIPTRLALTLAGTRSGVPYPAFVEALIMEVAFEALREAGVKLPTHMGQAVSIVGALIIGQAAVEAGLVSPAVVIIVATTAIFSFTIPYNDFSVILRLTRFLNMALAATLGIFGIMTGLLMICLNLVSQRSFGVPFMIPFAPLSLKDMKDWVLRFPQWAITQRSSHIVKNNANKKTKNIKPQPPTYGGDN